MTPETHYLKRMHREGALHGPIADFDALWARLTDWVRFRDLGIDADACRARIEAGGEKDARAIFAAMLQAYGERVGKPRVGEKTPGHSHYLDLLFTWFPDARVIAIQRDPRAVIASQSQTPWVKEKLTPRGLKGGFFTGKRAGEIAFYASNWAEVYSRVLPRWAGDPRVRVVSYERLVSSPEEEMRAICAFLGEEFEPAMLGDRQAAGVPGSASTLRDAAFEDWRREHEARSGRPISEASLERWRSRLTRGEIALIEARCGKGMAAAGYAPDLGPASHAVASGVAAVHGALAAGERQLREAARTIRAQLRQGEGQSARITPSVQKTAPSGQFRT